MKIKAKLTMHVTGWLAVVGMALSVPGCYVQSLHRLYTEKDLLFEPALVGTWVGMGKAEGDKSTIIFQKAEGQAYKVIYQPKEEGEPREFKGYMVRLGKFLFLDTFPGPAKEPITKNLMYAIHLLETHQIFRIQLDGDLLGVEMLVPDKVRERKAEIRHEAFGKPQAFLLTASTPELQEFVLKHAEDAFMNVGEWHRQKEGDQK